MCNCNELPACVADIELWLNRFPFQGALIHHRHFETPDSEYLEPPVEYQASMYRCMQCGQHWYIEGTPDENSTPEFALKAARLTVFPTDNEIKAAKNIFVYLHMVDLIQKNAGSLGVRIIS